MSDQYALVLAGGNGARLWPAQHKPLLTLDGSRSLFEQTIERLNGLVARENIAVVTDEALHPHLAALAPDLHYICEPSPRDTAAAVGLGLLNISRLNPNAVVAILSSDHFIADADRLRDSLRTGFAWAEQGHIALLGAEPTFPATGYGYIVHGDSLAPNVYRVERFIEKPPLETAQRLIDGEMCSWDAGMVVVRADVLLGEYARQQPQMLACVRDLSGWQAITPISLDYAIMEGAQNRIVVRLDTGWSDVGSWSALYDVLPRDANDNNVSPDTLTIEAQRVYVRSSKPTAVIGLDDVIVVDTDEGLLICRRDRAQLVRQAGQTFAAAVARA